MKKLIPALFAISSVFGWPSAQAATITGKVTLPNGTTPASASCFGLTGSAAIQARIALTWW